MANKRNTEQNAEIAAISSVHKALEGLTPDAQGRVLGYVATMLGIDIPTPQRDQSFRHVGPDTGPDAEPSQDTAEGNAGGQGGFEGISPVAGRWMTRNSLDAQGLTQLFSLGVDEIDLVAKTVPGENKKDKMHSVLLLKGIAAYLGTGVARFTHEELKEACLHYRAYDANNFASYMKSFSGDASGDKRTGYTLTARGLTTATDLVRQILQPEGPR